MKAAAAELPPVRVGLYGRYSTYLQGTGEMGTIESQDRFGVQHTEYMTATSGRRWDIVKVYHDEAYSGSNLARPGFQSLMADVRAGTLDRVLVYRMDRITRSLSDFFELDKVLSDHGVGLVSVKEQFDTATPIGRAMRNIILVFAELERETLAERVRDKLTQQVAAGVWAGGKIPYGYMRVERGKLEPDPEAVPILRLMFELYADQGFSTESVARILNEQGKRTRRGFLWNPRKVGEILQHEAYQGVQLHGNRRGPWPFEALLPMDLVERVHARYKTVAFTRGPNTVRHEWHKLLACGKCGAGVRLKVSHNRNGKTYQYLRCGSMDDQRHDGRPWCGLKPLPFGDLHQITAPVLLMAARSQPRPTLPPSPTLARELLEAQGRRERAIMAWVNGELDLATKDAIVQDCERKERDFAPPASPAHDAAVNLKVAWPALTAALRNAALREIVTRAIIYDDRVVVGLKETGWRGWDAFITVERGSGEWESQPFCQVTP